MTPQEIFAKSLVTYDKTSRSNDSFYYHCLITRIMIYATGIRCVCIVVM